MEDCLATSDDPTFPSEIPKSFHVEGLDNGMYATTWLKGDDKVLASFVESMVPSSCASDKSTVVPNGSVLDKTPLELASFGVPTSCTTNGFHVVLASMTPHIPWMIVVPAFL